MREIPPPQISRVSVSEKDVATLNYYTEKNLQETAALSEVMSMIPSIVQRGGIYLISAAVSFASILLYFGKIPIWINARGNIVSEVENISVLAEKSGIVTEVLAEFGQQLPKNATLLKFNPEQANLNPVSIPEELNAFQTQIDTEQDKVHKVTMPRAGTIGKLEIKNPGQLISKGNVVAVVIPADNKFIVKANVSEQDISSIKPGMEAQIKVDAYNFHQYGSIPAKINKVIPDLEQPGKFIVTLDLLTNRKQRNKQAEMTLFSGLNVRVEIQTKEQRLYELLFSK